jgi:hypothetical protein
MRLKNQKSLTGSKRFVSEDARGQRRLETLTRKDNDHPKILIKVAA